MLLKKIEPKKGFKKVVKLKQWLCYYCKKKVNGDHSGREHALTCVEGHRVPA